MKHIHNVKLRNTLIAWCFMAPAMAILLVFVFYPIVYSIPLAFTDYSVFGETAFTGLTNFKRLIADPDFWLAVKNSCVFVLMVPILQVLSIALALLVNRKLRGTAVFRVLIYLPVVTSMVAVAIIWKFIFDPNGLVNGLLMEWGWIEAPIRFLSSRALALPTMMAITIWQGLGYYMMIYLSALQHFPEELIEASVLDGASGWQTFWKVRIPLLQPQIWFCSMVSTIAALGIFDVVFTITNGTGGPDKSTYVINFYSYFQAFNKFDFGYSAAIGIVLALITLVFNLALNVYQKKGGDVYD
ncbi:ABC transporter permease [Oscillospiraceae bacterium]|uniref:carbohydrate ABC transporter permease n=1 Tax=Allofournierella sp. TaxID=1940256 RepID=UPI0015B0D380|nr:ABC transporter permease [Oscillospiraceae bacterium]